MRRFLIVAALALAGCSAEPTSLESFAQREVTKLEPSAGKVTIDKVELSQSARVACGMARIGSVRTTPFSIEMDRPFPTGDAVKVLVVPSIDNAPDPEAVRSNYGRLYDEVAAPCIAAGLWPRPLTDQEILALPKEVTRPR